MSMRGDTLHFRPPVMLLSGNVAAHQLSRDDCGRNQCTDFCTGVSERCDQTRSCPPVLQRGSGRFRGDHFYIAEWRKLALLQKLGCQPVHAISHSSERGLGSQEERQDLYISWGPFLAGSRDASQLLTLHYLRWDGVLDSFDGASHVHVKLLCRKHLKQ